MKPYISAAFFVRSDKKPILWLSSCINGVSILFTESTIAIFVKAFSELFLFKFDNVFSNSF